MQNQKARSLKKITTAITRRFGKLSLAPLRKMTEEKCEEFLCSLPGVGKKVARCVMLYSLGMKVFPVDTHCWRIAKRWGWIKANSKHKFCTSKEALRSIMKNKRFDCVEMKHKGAERVYQAIVGFSREQQIDFWKRGSEALRQALQKAQEKKTPMHCK